MSQHERKSNWTVCSMTCPEFFPQRMSSESSDYLSFITCFWRTTECGSCMKVGVRYITLTAMRICKMQGIRKGYMLNPSIPYLGHLSTGSWSRSELGEIRRILFWPVQYKITVSTLLLSVITFYWLEVSDMAVIQWNNSMGIVDYWNNPHLLLNNYKSTYRLAIYSINSGYSYTNRG